MNKPLMSLSIDLDDLWAYLKVKGDPSWESFPTYLNKFLPGFLKLLDELKLKITFFIIGNDAAFSHNQDLFREIVKRGHEVANHTMAHDAWLNRYTQEELAEEVAGAEEMIYKATGERPVGFRGPGFTWNKDLLELLSARNYLYDSSTLPSYISPLARLYYFWTAGIRNEDKEQRSGLYGSFKEGFRPLKPYLWNFSGVNTLLEIPVTTIPCFKTPFHLSYLMYAASHSQMLAKNYFKTALLMCRITRTSPNFLLHPPDFMDSKEVPEMSFFPGMNLPHKLKRELFIRTIKSFEEHYTIVPLRERAENELKHSLRKVEV